MTQTDSNPQETPILDEQEANNVSLESTPALFPALLPWECQPSESPRAFAAFVVFRDLPSSKRTIAQVLSILRSQGSAAQKTVREYFVKYSWLDRVAAWEAYLDSRRRSASERGVISAARRQTEVGNRMVEVGLQALERIAAHPESIGTADARLLIMDGAKLIERAQGLVTDSDKDKETLRDQKRLEDYSDEELKRLAQLGEGSPGGIGEAESE